MEKILLVYLFIISIVTVILTVYDKVAAKKRRFRISEATLMLCGVFGGAVADFVTMLLLRHKTRHFKFMLGLPLIITAHVAIAAVLLIFGVIHA